MGVQFVEEKIGHDENWVEFWRCIRNEDLVHTCEWRGTPYGMVIGAVPWARGLCIRGLLGCSCAHGLTRGWCPLHERSDDRQGGPAYKWAVVSLVQNSPTPRRSPPQKDIPTITNTTLEAQARTCPAGNCLRRTRGQLRSFMNTMLQRCAISIEGNILKQSRV